MSERLSNTHYQRLYRLQDRIFRVLDELNLGFYLTGGTALGRFYLQHRYSDDLDFFIHEEPRFLEFVRDIIEGLKNSGVAVEPDALGAEFSRCTAYSRDIAPEISLKIDFVNEKNVPRFGEFLRFEEFSRVDNWRNILSNKITTLSRQEPKDVADIWFICKTYEFRWDEIIREAGEKEAVDELLIVDLLRTFPEKDLDRIKWIRPIGLEQFRADRNKIIRDILTKSDNSLAK